MIQDVLVLAAGNSTRISDIAHGLPKPLLAVAGRAVLDRNLEWLATEGVRRVWINLHYRPAVIREAIGDGSRFGLSIHYTYEPTILGTAGAWKQLEPQWSGTSLVVYGDNLIRFRLAPFLDHHRASGALASIALFDPTRHVHTGIAGGRVELDDGSWVVNFVEGTSAPPGHRNYVNAGAYLLEPAVGQFVPAGFQDFGKDVFPNHTGARRLLGHVFEDRGYCLGLDTPASFAVAHDIVHSARVVLT
jgi:NDP-sugar pyrophosphorylase family protein